MKMEIRQPRWKVLLAFAIIYFVWGSTFLAIRIGVRHVPPFTLAAMRFLVAGTALYLWTVVRGERSPSGRQWASAFLLAVLIFVLDYGLLFWAEQRVPSGLAAVMLATIPLFTALSETIILHTQKLTLRLLATLFIGIAGIAVLVSRSLGIGGTPVDRTGAAALMIAGISWSLSAALMRKLPLPQSQVMSSGMQMLAGAILLAITAAGLREFQNFHPSSVPLVAWLSLAYLIVVESIVAYTAYVWLIHHQPITKVGTYAYVNPVIAVFLGYFVGGEPLALRTILGTACVLISVVMITTMRAKPVVTAIAKDKVVA